jgi:uncharacterized membrane protein
MDSFIHHIREKTQEPTRKNFVLKKSHDKVYQLLDSDGKELLKTKSISDAEEYAKKHDANIVRFNEDRMPKI